MPRVHVTKTELTKAVLDRLMEDHFPEASEKQKVVELAERFAEASGKVRRSKAPDVYKTETVDQSALDRAQRRLASLSAKLYTPPPVVQEAEPEVQAEAVEDNVTLEDIEI